jgi:hypothetical protein
MWAVRNCEIRRSIQQRARRVADVVVSLQHRDYSGAPTFVVLEDIERPRQALQLITEAALASRRQHDGEEDGR